MVLAVPLTLLTLVAAHFRWTAPTITPSDTRDDDASAGIVLSCVVTLAAAETAAAPWLMPSARRSMPWWWILPALLLGLVAGA
ncbi:hypothetical protein GCM10010269_50170 [Streptomyces humidus]|uniref:Uncharacterized protein n=1 Tax=Streptomyces humidus TaxID=52259 RepID=A0A918FZ11_9ACTN|nr:hypothetical protein [Streptomyces humidus]GGS05285.1 hypothetical protein GCM10010269_50170 [Streptomyces humidus]